MRRRRTIKVPPPAKTGGHLTWKDAQSLVQGIHVTTEGPTWTVTKTVPQRLVKEFVGLDEALDYACELGRSDEAQIYVHHPEQGIVTFPSWDLKNKTFLNLVDRSDLRQRPYRVTLKPI